MMYFSLKQSNLEAERVTPYSIKRVAQWCQGQLKGIQLPIEDWVIDVRSADGAEHRAEMGDWLCREVGTKDWIVLSKETLAQLYVRLHDEAADYRENVRGTVELVEANPTLILGSLALVCEAYAQAVHEADPGSTRGPSEATL